MSELIIDKKSIALAMRVLARNAQQDPAAFQTEVNVFAQSSPTEFSAIQNAMREVGLEFGGASVTSTTAVTENSVRISDSYIGKKYGNEEGLFLGYFDLGNDVGEKPIFVLELTKESMTFVHTVKAQGTLPNGYVADPYTYDARQGLREGKTVIATFDMVMAAYKEQDKFEENGKNGKPQKMFKDAGWVLTSSPHPVNPYGVRIVGFRVGGVDWGFKGYFLAPSLLVRTALTL
ncbi:MAG: hypothetical protein WC612_04535 [Bdellovibrionales bacterium]|jgi:hypothetical protein